MLDWLLYNLLRFFVGLARCVPLEASLSLARVFGSLAYFVAGKQNRRALANLQRAFPEKSPAARQRILRQMHRLYAQNVTEALYVPHVEASFFERHIRVSNAQAIRSLLKEKRPVIFLGCHAGSWELSNIATAHLFREAPYAMLARPQSRTPRLDAFLNRIREGRRCRVIRINELKRMVEHLSAGGMLGMVADHGGKEGVPVSFFGQLAMTPTGSMKLARKMNAQIVLAFMHRLSGSHHEMLFAVHKLIDAPDAQDDLRINLEAIHRVFEAWIRQYPQEYLWTFRRWKHSSQKNVLVVSDGKAGHAKQSAALVYAMRGLGFDVTSDTVDVIFRRPWAGRFLAVLVRVLGPGGWATRFLSWCAGPQTSRRLLERPWDAVISAGSSVAAVNRVVAYQYGARSVAIMKPGILPYSSFDLVVMPRHDAPPARPNIIAVHGALCAVTQASMTEDFQALVKSRPDLKEEENFSGTTIGLLIGGDAKNCELPAAMVRQVCQEIKKFLEARQAHLLVTTSRRTSGALIQVLRDHFGQDSRCRLLVVACEDNPPGAVGGIFHLSDILIVSGESISMVSEAIASRKPVIVFEPRCRTRSHKSCRFLEESARAGLIHRVAPDEIRDRCEELTRDATNSVPAGAGTDLQGALKKLF